jgi:hypothetical protein
LAPSHTQSLHKKFCTPEHDIAHSSDLLAALGTCSICHCSTSGACPARGPIGP